jgi:fumarate hydratase class I
MLEAAQNSGFGAQFGGKYFALDVRVVRLPRHGASCPIGMGVSCSADRNIKAHIDRDGSWIEELRTQPGSPHSRTLARHQGSGRRQDRSRSADGEILVELRKHRSNPAVALAADDRGARHRARQAPGALGRGRRPAAVFQGSPDLLRRTREDAGRYAVGFVRADDRGTDGCVRRWFPIARRLARDAGEGQPHPAVTEACQKHGGFYLGRSAARRRSWRRTASAKVEVIEYPELGMEAIYRIEVVDFPAFVLVDDKGNDFFRRLR